MGGALTFPNRRTLQLWQDLSWKIVQIYCIFKPSLQTSFMNPFGHFIKLSDASSSVEKLRRLGFKCSDLFPDLQLPPATLDIRTAVKASTIISRTIRKKDFSSHANAISSVYPSRLCLWGLRSPFPGLEARVDILANNTVVTLFQVQLKQREFSTNYQRARFSLTNAPKLSKSKSGSTCLRSFFCCHPGGGAGAGSVASSFITTDTSSRSSAVTTERKNLFCTLTHLSVPGEEEEKFGAGDGDHLAHVGIWPAGDLVPHPPASWAQTKQQVKEGCSNHTHLKRKKMMLFLSLQWLSCSCS